MTESEADEMEEDEFDQGDFVKGVDAFLPTSIIEEITYLANRSFA